METTYFDGFNQLEQKPILQKNNDIERKNDASGCLCHRKCNWLEYLRIALVIFVSIRVCAMPVQAGWVAVVKENVHEHPWKIGFAVVGTVLLGMATLGIGEGVVVLLVGGGEALAAANGAAPIAITAAQVMAGTGLAIDGTDLIVTVTSKSGG